MSPYEALIREFVKATETFQLTATVAQRILHEKYQQVEYPNLLNKKGQTSDLAETLSRMLAAPMILKSQTYDISSITECANRLIMEARWSGEMKIDAGPLKAGQRLKAFFCMVFEFKDEKIFAIRNYDCFEAF